MVFGCNEFDKYKLLNPISKGEGGIPKACGQPSVMPHPPALFSADIITLWLLTLPFLNINC